MKEETKKQEFCDCEEGKDCSCDCEHEKENNTEDDSAEQEEKKSQSFLPLNPSKKKMAKQVEQFRQKMESMEKRMGMMPSYISALLKSIVEPLGNEVKISSGALSDMNSRVNALVELMSIDRKAFEDKVEELKIKDFNDYQAIKDKENGIEQDIDGVVKETSIVVAKLENKNDPKDCLIRTKIDLNDKDVRQMLGKEIIGLEVGDNREIKIEENQVHKITIIEIKKKSEKNNG